VTIRRVLLIPGLLEPRVALWPLQRALAESFPQADIWRDRIVFRDLDRSVGRLAEAISGADRKDLAIVTHSFGDWVTRQAIARTESHRVAALVSIAPAMRAGLLSRLAYLMTWRLTPELTVINDRRRVGEHLDCDADLKRLVLWARFDESLRRVPLSTDGHTRVECVTATHLSIVLQPKVLARTADFIRSVDAEHDETGL
jgi:hypothetical protein